MREKSLKVGLFGFKTVLPFVKAAYPSLLNARKTFNIFSNGIIKLLSLLLSRLNSSNKSLLLFRNSANFTLSSYSLLNLNLSLGFTSNNKPRALNSLWIFLKKLCLEAKALSFIPFWLFVYLTIFLSRFPFSFLVFSSNTNTFTKTNTFSNSLRIFSSLKCDSTSAIELIVWHPFTIWGLFNLKPYWFLERPPLDASVPRSVSHFSQIIVIPLL